jgi:hypothetical protein
VKWAGIFGESFHGIPLLGLVAVGPEPEGRSDDLISPAVAFGPVAGAGGSAVRAISIGWAAAVAGASTGGGVTSVAGLGAAGWAFANSLPQPRQNL